jgi:hypothetical protein
MKSFLRVFATALAVTVGLIALWSLLLLIFFVSTYYFGPIQGIVALVFVTVFILTALIHWSEQGNFPYR